MPKYSWPEYPRPFESNFEGKAYTALDAWRNNSADMDNRVGDIEGFLTDCSDFQPGTGTFNSLTANALLQTGVMYRKYWVDGTVGSDSNPGTSSAPFKTIKKAIDSIPIGGRGAIYLAAGQNFIIDESIIQMNKTISFHGNIDDKPKIIFDTFLSGGYNACYSIRLQHSLLVVHGCILENAPPKDPSSGWTIGGGVFAPLVVSGDGWYVGGVSLIYSTVNQSCPIFIASKHAFSFVNLNVTSINFSGDAVGLISAMFGCVSLSAFSVSATSGFKYVHSGSIGHNVLTNLNSLDT